MLFLTENTYDRPSNCVLIGIYIRLESYHYNQTLTPNR